MSLSAVELVLVVVVAVPMIALWLVNESSRAHLSVDPRGRKGALWASVLHGPRPARALSFKAHGVHGARSRLG